ncbi:glycerophosphodiester phosphodiesterase [Micrococcales bacterium 31B]|nr:glycerophosphodiester phosphodiesterase [Micrococcales bacterium 31B]
MFSHYPSTSRLGFPVCGRPLIVAHRGSSGTFPEHTPLAYEAALSDGADGIECDIRVTADEKLVCCHDRDLQRTSSGSGSIERHSLAELLRLDWGSHRENLPPGGRQLLTFDGFLDMARGADRPVALFIETKHPSDHGRRVERLLLESLRRHGVGTPREPQLYPILMSFSAFAVRRLRASGLPTATLSKRGLALRLKDAVAGSSALIGPRYGRLAADPELVPTWQARGRAVNAWTVNQPERVRQCIEWGVDAITTNFPGMARTEMVRMSESVPRAHEAQRDGTKRNPQPERDNAEQQGGR